MIVETELAAKHTTAVLAEMSMIRHTDVAAVVTFLTDVFAVVSFLYMVSLIALVAAVAATEESGHGCNEVKVMILQVDVYFFHTWNLLLWRLGNDFLVVLRINIDLVLREKNSLNMVNVSERILLVHRKPESPQLPSNVLLQ